MNEHWFVFIHGCLSRAFYYPMLIMRLFLIKNEERCQKFRRYMLTGLFPVRSSTSKSGLALKPSSGLAKLSIAPTALIQLIAARLVAYGLLFKSIFPLQAVTRTWNFFFGVLQMIIMLYCLLIFLRDYFSSSSTFKQFNGTITILSSTTTTACGAPLRPARIYPSIKPFSPDHRETGRGLLFQLVPYYSIS